MNDKEFARKAFQDALKATDVEITDEEYQSFEEHVAKKSSVILESAKYKCEIFDGLEMEEFAKTIFIGKQVKAFTKFTSALMMICFQIGWRAAKKEI